MKRKGGIVLILVLIFAISSCICLTLQNATSGAKSKSTTESTPVAVAQNAPASTNSGNTNQSNVATTAPASVDSATVGSKTVSTGENDFSLQYAQDNDYEDWTDVDSSYLDSEQFIDQIRNGHMVGNYVASDVLSTYLYKAGIKGTKSLLVEESGYAVYKVETQDSVLQVRLNIKDIPTIGKIWYVSGYRQVS